MPARSGKQYVESLRRLQPTVYLGGRRVRDVTEEPVFRPAIQAVAEQYDMQLLPAYHEIMTYPSPTTGDPVSTSFMLPRSKADVVKMSQHFKLRTDHNFGFMGRGPDFMNMFIANWVLNRETFARGGAQFAENVTRYYEHVREHDLFLTHTLINPQTDRSKTSANQEDPFIHLGRVRATSEGIVVRGAKMLGTMAPIAEELAVIPAGGVAPGDDAYALGFAIPNNTPGLKYICRETVAPPPRTRFDHPLSSRFEEMDCIAIFEDVLVPWERVVVDGSPGSREIVNAVRATTFSVGALQTSARLLSQLEFFCGLAMKLADAIGITGFLHIQEKLGEMLMYLEEARTIYHGSVELAQEGPDGVWAPYPLGLRAFHVQAASRTYRRVVEIVQTLTGGGFFYAPTEADLQHPELRPLIDKYVRGRPGVSAEERIALFKLAWDVTGDSFAQRMQQYVHFYSGDPVRNTAGYYVGYAKEPLFEIVERALGHRGDLDIPITPPNPGTVPRPPEGALSGNYPATSLPAAATAP